MDLTLTLSILIAALAAALAANLLSRRPAKPGRVWTIPYNGVQFLALLVAILMLAHLVTLLTGQPFAGRAGR